MEQTCDQAVRLGLPSIAFTDHADFTPWVVESRDDAPAWLRHRVTSDGTFVPPELDLTGYLECLDRCRHLFPDLRILSGVELSDAHWHHELVADLLGRVRFDRVVLGLHSAVGADGRFVEVLGPYDSRPSDEVVREYLVEITRMIEAVDTFEVLAHIDYPLRNRAVPVSAQEILKFEIEYRAALRALARSDRALEVNTQVPLHSEVLRLWREEGGKVISFGSDAHDPLSLARGFSEAAAMAEGHGFKPGRHPYDLWYRP